MAERGGFEPPVAFDYSRFPGVRVKPLCHLSTRCKTNRFERINQLQFDSLILQPEGCRHEKVKIEQKDPIGQKSPIPNLIHHVPSGILFA